MEEDSFLFNDKWFRGVDLSEGPDGGVYILDWCDAGECHERSGVHRTSGRIYKITYGDKLSPAKNLESLSPEALLQALQEPDGWQARQVQTLIPNAPDLVDALKSMVVEDPNPVIRLRAMWALSQLLPEPMRTTFMRLQLKQPDEHVRAWAIRLITDLWPLDTVVSQRPPGRKEGHFPYEFPLLAQEDSSGLVRLTLASAMQRMHLERRATVAGALMSHAEDATDHNLPLLVWYGLIPIAENRPAELVPLIASTTWPITRRFMIRRLTEDLDGKAAPLAEVLAMARTRDEAFKADVLTGMTAALAGWRKANAPQGWVEFAASLADSKNPELLSRVRDLSALFGDGRALDAVKAVALDAKTEMGSRKSALQTLIDNRPPDLREICEKLLTVRFLNPIAARGLSTMDDPAIGVKLAAAYSSFHPSERAQLLAALTSRPSFVPALLEAIQQGKIPRAEITAFHARQIAGFHDEAITKRLTQVWGEFHETSGDKAALIAKFKSTLTADMISKANLSAGRVMFQQLCATCHTLYGQGGKLGPDLTGAGRDNLDYLLENVLDPSAAVSADFKLNVVTLKDGRVLAGMIREKKERTLTVQTMTEAQTIERGDIKETSEMATSMMPEGLLQACSQEQVRDLIGYLMCKSQVP